MKFVYRWIHWGLKVGTYIGFVVDMEKERINHRGSYEGYLQEWKAQAFRCQGSYWALLRFIRLAFVLTFGFIHDDASGIRAQSCLALAAALVFVESPARGQQGSMELRGSAIFWELDALMFGDAGPSRVLRYQYLLKPEYSSVFEKRLSPDQAAWLMNEAKLRMMEDSRKDEKMSAEEFNHLNAISRGVFPFGYYCGDTQGISASLDLKM